MLFMFKHPFEPEDIFQIAGSNPVGTAESFPYPIIQPDQWGVPSQVLKANLRLHSVLIQQVIQACC